MRLALPARSRKVYYYLEYLQTLFHIHLWFHVHLMLKRISQHVKNMYMIILVINFMQGIYIYIPETHHVSRVYSVAVVL